MSQQFPSSVSALITAVSRSGSSVRLLWRQHGSWVLEDVLFPVLLTRLILLLVAWFSRPFPVNQVYPIQEAVVRGWHFSPYRLLDVWGRWDTGWYFSIIREGYYLNGDVQSAQSNVAFFPLYPMLVKGMLWLVPDHFETAGVILFAGVVLSNVFLLVALVLLHRLVVFYVPQREIAQKTIVYLLAYPTGYFYSSFYTESLFLMLSVAAFWAASQRRWAVAGLCGLLLGLTRPLGILIVLPLLWIYLSQVNWQFRHINSQLLWLLLVPLGMLAFLFYIERETGFFWAPLQIQAAWQRQLMPPWVALLTPSQFTAGVTPIAQVLTVLFLIGSLLIFRYKSLMAYGLYSGLLLVPTLIHGTLLSNGRYYMTIFPVFVVAALLSKRKFIYHAAVIFLLTLQVLYMFSWSQFFWVE